MKSASPTVVPNVFVKQACLGDTWAAEGSWVKRRPELNGFSPYELWDHPELLLSEQEREENPALGAFTLVTVRSMIVRTLASLYSRESTLVVAHSVGNLPYYDSTLAMPSVREEDPAPVNDIPSPIGRRVLPADFDAPAPVRTSASKPRVPRPVRVTAPVPDPSTLSETARRFHYTEGGQLRPGSNGSHPAPASAFRHGNRRSRRGGRAFRGR